MTSRLLVALLAPALVAVPAFAQEGDAPAADAAAPAAEAAAPAEAGGDSDTSDPTKGTKGSKGGKGSGDGAGAAVASGMVGMSAGEGFPLHFMASLSHAIGQGTFIAGYADNPYVASSLSLNPYAFFGGFRFGISQSFDFEYTQSDSTTYPNQLMWSDMGLQVAYPGFRLPDLGLGFVLNAGASLPISMASRQQGRLTGLSAGAQVNWGYTPWGISVFAGASGNYNVLVPSLASRGALDDVRPLEDRHQGTIIPSSCVRRSAEELGNYACSVIPSLGGYNVRGGASWSTLGGQLSFNATVALMQQFSAFIGPDDELTPPNAQTGLQQRDVFTTGVLQATYVPVSWFLLTVGTQTFQPLYTSRRDGIRVFPFWDFTSMANNYSSIFLDTTFMF